MKNHRISDPVELEIARALDSIGVKWTNDEVIAKRLDFYLLDYDVYIECKAYHSQRILGQMGRVPNIIVVQGLSAAKCFAAMIKLVGIK